MKKVHIGKALTIIGNLNRIAEMIPHAGDNAIAGHFQDQGVNITPEFVREMRNNCDEFSSKSVSKKSTNDFIESVKKDKQEDSVIQDDSEFQT